MYTKLLSVVLCMASVAIAQAVQPEIFQKKGKYGLLNPDTGKEILKAKYDTIYPFKGREYTRVMKKGKYGLVTQDGKEYLGCKFQKILFPEFTTSNGKRYFWATENGKSYFRHSDTDFYTTPFFGVFYGSDKEWYGVNSNGQWLRIVSNSTVAPANFKGNAPHRTFLPKGYLVFNGDLYTPKPNRKKICEQVANLDTVTIAEKSFIKGTIGNDAMLLDSSTGTLWKKDKPGLNGLYSAVGNNPGYNLLVADQQLNKAAPFGRDLPLFVVINPEYNLKGLFTSDMKKVLPMKFTNIKLNENIGSYNGEKMWKVTLESQQPVFAPELEGLVKELRNIHPDFVILTNNSMGKSLFGSTGEEIIHNTAETVFVQDGLLKAKANGKEIVISTEGPLVSAEDYDAIWHSDKGNLTRKDLVVQKNGKVGLVVIGQGEIIPPKYEGFRRQWGHIFAYDGDLVALYDDYGNLVIPLKYKDITIANAYTKPNYYLATTPSGAKTLLGDKGRVILAPGIISDADFMSGDEGKWCKVFKNGKMGIMNLQAGKIVIPCVYENNIFFGSGTWPNRKIGVYRSTSRGEQIDIWTMGGKKITSKTFPSSHKYTMKRWLENQLNASFYYD